DARKVRINRLETGLPRDEIAVLDLGDRAGMNRIVLVARTVIPRAAGHVGLEVLDVAECFSDRSAIDLGRVQLQQRVGSGRCCEIPGLREGVSLVAWLAVFGQDRVPVLDVAALLVQRLELELDKDAAALVPIRTD